MANFAFTIVDNIRNVCHVGLIGVALSGLFRLIEHRTGASRDILVDRLRKLETAGAIERRQYSEHPPRYEYHLAEAGRDLFPVMLALRQWGDTWAVGSPVIVHRHGCGRPVQVDLICRHCGEPVTQDTVHPELDDSRPEPDDS